MARENADLMVSLWKPSVPVVQAAIGPDTMIYHGKAISLMSEVGALALLHGALQSAIASVDDACAAESVYLSAVSGLSANV